MDTRPEMNQFVRKFLVFVVLIPMGLMFGCGDSSPLKRYEVAAAGNDLYIVNSWSGDAEIVQGAKRYPVASVSLLNPKPNSGNRLQETKKIGEKQLITLELQSKKIGPNVVVKGNISPNIPQLLPAVGSGTVVSIDFLDEDGFQIGKSAAISGYSLTRDIAGSGWFFQLNVDTVDAEDYAEYARHFSVSWRTDIDKAVIEYLETEEGKAFAAQPI